jgi:type IV pilus assembly protein PilQ
MNHSQPRALLWLIILTFISAGVFHGCAKPPAAGTAAVAPVSISKIEPRETDGKIEIQVEGDAPITQYTSYQLTEPLRLVVDITGADISKFKDKIPVAKGPVLDIAPSQAEGIARLEIGLSQAVDAKLNQENGTLVIQIAKSAEEAKQATESVKPVLETAATPTPAGEQPAAGTPAGAEKTATGTATVVTAVKATAGKNGVKVVITANGTMVPNTFMLEGKKLVIDVPGTRNKVRPKVILVRKGGLDKVRVGQYTAQTARVVLDLTRPMTYTATPEGNTLLIALSTAATATSEEQPPQEKAAAKETEQAQEGEQEKTAPPAPEVPAAPPAPAQVKPARAEKQPAGPPDTSSLIGGGKFSGRRISLDLQDADLINVLRLFADVANLNIIIAPDVKGRVTVRMVNIPWDQAMDIILKMNGLGFALEDNVLRIASVAVLTKQAEDEFKAKDAKKKAEDLVTRMVPINYATAGTILPTLKKSLSNRGDAVVDDRTNTIIITDIAKNVNDILALVKVLDKAIPQVMIEARIIEANTNFARDIGVQWGGTYKADAAHGNPPGFNFPNTITATGGPSQATTQFGAGNYLVNLPAAVGQGAGGSIGFNFGSLSKALNLDLALSAMESTGEGKVISTPRVSALDNKEAKIEQGESIPYATTSASGTQVQFIDAKLSLTVTPHVTPDNKIFLKIAATKDAPDTALVFNGQPSIRKNQATTEILLADGETAVIGGILIIDRGYAISKVPFFGDLPLIGWLFREKTQRDNKTELLIFITPRIVRQETL